MTATEPEPRDEAGFTLIEVMIALTLTAVAVLGLIAMYASSMKASGFSRHQAEAAALAQEKVEQLRSGPAGSIGSGSDVNLDPIGSAGTGIYTRKYSQTADSSGAYDDILVTVSWSDDGTAHHVTVYARRNDP